MIIIELQLYLLEPTINMSKNKGNNKSTVATLSVSSPKN